MTPRSLNFGASSTLGEFTVRNASGGSLQAIAPTFNANWLSVVPVNISAENLDTYGVTVDRTGLSDGIYSDTITVQSNVNTVQVSVIMQVSSTIIEADAGYLYVLLIDSDTGAVVDQVDLAASGGGVTRTNSWIFKTGSTKSLPARIQITITLSAILARPAEVS